MGSLGGPGILPKATSVVDRSTDEACIVQVPGTGWFGSGHCVVIAGSTVFFQASGIKPKNLTSASPSLAPHNSFGLGRLGHLMASLGFLSLSTENIGRST